MQQGQEKKSSNVSEIKEIQGKASSPEFGARSMGAEVSQLFKKGQETVGEITEKAEHYASQASKQLMASVKEYPLRSLMIGFGVGCLAGVLLGRR